MIVGCTIGTCKSSYAAVPDEIMFSEISEDQISPLILNSNVDSGSSSEQKTTGSANRYNPSDYSVLKARIDTGLPEHQRLLLPLGPSNSEDHQLITLASSTMHRVELN